jgi:hypothetical protein
MDSSPAGKIRKGPMSFDPIRTRRGQDAMRPCASTASLPTLSPGRAAVLTVAAAVACFGLQLRALAAEGDNAGVTSDMAVTGLSAKNMCFTDTLQVTGVLVPKNEILVRPEREGLQISQVLVEPGDPVTSGQTLESRPASRPTAPRMIRPYCRARDCVFGTWRAAAQWQTRRG